MLKKLEEKNAAPKVNGVYSGQRPIIHPNFVEIYSVDCTTDMGENITPLVDQLNGSHSSDYTLFTSLIYPIISWL